MEREQDPRLARLTNRLRDDGTAPARDLWPGIDEAIDRREEAGYRRPRTVWWRAAAAAAAVLVLVVGTWQLLPDNPGTREADHGEVQAIASIDNSENTENTDTPANGMSAISKALAELNDALAADPDNHNLSRLVLMVHRTRGELMRRSPDRDLHTNWNTGG